MALSLAIAAGTASGAATAIDLDRGNSRSQPASERGLAPSRVLGDRIRITSSADVPAATSPVGASKTPTNRGIFTSRITAAPTAVRDNRGGTWSRMPLTLGTTSRLKLDGISAVSGLAGPEYSWVARNPKGYALAVPSGTYRVRLLLVEPSATSAGKRVFSVQAEGKTVSRVDIAGSVGRSRTHDVTFNARVSDGRLDMRFVPVVGEPIISGIEVMSTGQVTLPTNLAVRPAVALAASSPYLTKIRNAPLAANSAQSIRSLAAQVDDHWGGTAATNAYQYNGSFYPVPARTPRIRVGFHDCQKRGDIPAGLYDGAKHFVDVPVPSNAIPATGGDGQLTIYDKAADQLWEFWQMRKNPAGTWEACWGGRMDGVSKGIGQFPVPYGASASGLTVASGMITIDEARAGRVEHAMSLAIIDLGRWDRVSWPANRSDGGSEDVNALMAGQRIRLDPRLDLNAVDLTPFGRMVAEAAQEYGFIITDRSGAVAVSTESGAAEKARTGEDPWDVLLGGPPYLALKNFPWQHMQALPKDYGKP